ncbi:hypothetical protein SAMN05216559_3757 [Halomicrobium zhouii]|uniref:Halobacterial output domain-containing protein n=1 Tax=Halomicrobium zhouii TaxID=767519 RepID=A0A1I6M494_9EURY|nr:HalOD1 output domain-containing protein [Halomicrobium zhouii]SFS10557.1 hypothetical protein SAMN05216559_3757 [Halomicrobium zhouii]
MDGILLEYDARVDQYYVDMPLDGSSDVGRAVVVAIGEILDQDPVSLPPLGEVIDTESLTAVFDGRSAESESDASVSFDYSGFAVTVHCSGRITFDERR